VSPGTDPRETGPPRTDTPGSSAARTDTPETGSPRTDAPVRILVVDDHPIWRQSVARDLAEAGCAVVGTAGDGAQALRVAKATRPDVVLLDLHLPDMSGAEVTRQLLGTDPPARVLVLSASGERQDVLDAVTAGATGYLVKSAQFSELTAAVRSAAAGQAVFTPGLAGLVLGEFRRLAAGRASGGAADPVSGRAADAGPRPPAVPALTDRETQILRLVAKGLTYPQIAAMLVLSTRTVQNHVQNTLVKLQLHNKAQLVRYAMERGIE
jgi:DNA-binding NarL/FixJ family response regulator